MLVKTFGMQDNEKKETALMRAVRMQKLDMVYAMLHMVSPSEILSNVSFVTQTDLTGRNLLHWAIITK